MPLPSPKAREDKKSFISRCVSLLSDKNEGNNTSQRVAICNSQWKKSKSTILTEKEVFALKKIMGK